MAEHYENGRKKTKQVMTEQTKEKNRVRARNAYRLKAGIPLDADLCDRGGAHHVKYSSKEEARLAKNKKQRERKLENIKAENTGGYKGMTRKEYNKMYYLKNKEKRTANMRIYYEQNKEKIGNCSDCPGYFEAGKDNCKTCDFDLNAYNKSAEEYCCCCRNPDEGLDGGCKCDCHTEIDTDEDEECDCDTLTISQITNDLDEYMKKYKMSFNV